MRMNICLCFGPSWKDKISVQLFQIFRLHPDRRIKAYLISEHLTEEDVKEYEWIAEKFGNEVQYISLTNFFARQIKTRLNINARFTKYTLYRLAIPFFIPDDRLLYLDADTIVMQRLDELFDIEFGKFEAAGVLDTGIPQAHLAKYKMSQDYINAGMIMMDLKTIREKKYGEKWMELANKVNYPTNDQDIINLTMKGKIKLVGKEWNTSISTGLELPEDKIKVMHYAGTKEPWIEKLPNSHLWYKVESEYYSWRSENETKPAEKISRLIAYGWFGRNPKPENIQKCIDSWKICGYDVVELNEDNCDVNETKFTKVAYETKKWAYVSDYFRMKAMYEWGCITLDADVEIVKPLDQFLVHSFFSGQEINDKVLITATMGAEKGHPLIRMILEYYQLMEFDPNKMVPNTQFLTEILKLFIKDRRNGKIILYGDGHLYPQAFFCNFDHKKLKVIETPEAYSYHRFQSSWRKR